MGRQGYTGKRNTAEPGATPLPESNLHNGVRGLGKRKAHDAQNALPPIPSPVSSGLRDMVGDESVVTFYQIEARDARASRGLSAPI